MIYNFFVIKKSYIPPHCIQKNDCTLNIVHVTATVMSSIIIMIARTTIYGNEWPAFCRNFTEKKYFSDEDRMVLLFINYWLNNEFWDHL